VVTVTFGTGEMSGVFANDVICVGSICTRSNFVSASEESEEPFNLVPFDGILGLSLPEMSEGPSFNVFDCMIRDKVLKENLFSVYFDHENSAKSEITFGEINTEHMASPLIYVPVSQPGYWQVPMEDITIGNVQQGLCGEKGEKCQVAVDTGTSLLAGPTEIVNSIVDQLLVDPDCSNFNSLPNLGFMVGGHILNLTPEDYIEKGPEGCVVALMTLDIPPPRGPLFIFGDPFLRKYFTVYDRGNLRVGFAVAKQSGKTDTGLIVDPATLKNVKRHRGESAEK